MRELLAVVFAAGLVLAWLFWPRTPPEATAPSAVTGLLGGPPGDLPRIEGPHPLSFPEDHGAHPAYRHEWWYFTGYLETGDTRTFGFQYTLFRFRIPGPGGVESAWATEQVWMAHLALSDIERGRFRQVERLARGALDLAGAEPGRWWLRDWTVTDTGDGWHLAADAGDFALDLQLAPGGPPILQGEAGYSRKGPEAGNATMYYSHPRLSVTGGMRLGETGMEVTGGEAWLDREWGTSALGPDLAGWDWFALHLDGGRRLMVYRLRTDDGTTAPWSAGKWIDDTGARTLSPRDFELIPGRTWTDVHGHDWPVSWRLRVPGEDLEAVVEAAFPEQLWTGRVEYWEGAVNVRAPDGDPVGRGYLEMTGYGGG